MAEGSPAVTVVIPFFKARPYVLTAVRSVLRQTFSDLRVVVISDGDPEVPADRLRRLDPQRVLVFELPENRGTYFVREVGRRASRSPWFAMLDADDIVERTWLERSLECAERTGVAFVDQRRFLNYGPFRRTLDLRPVDLTVAGHCPAHYFASLNALVAMERLEAMGGFDGSFRVGFDKIAVNLIALTGPVGAVHEPLYLVRRGDRLRGFRSLTTDPATGKRSDFRKASNLRRDAIYARAHPEFLRDPEAGRALLLDERDPEIEREIAHHSADLRRMLDGRATDG